MVSTTLLTTGANWGANTATIDSLTGTTASWSGATTSNNWIQTCILGAIDAIELATNGIVFDESDLVMVLNPTTARMVARTAEIKDYIKGSPDAIDVQTGQIKGRNRRYGLPENLYGVEVVVENAVKETARKNATSSKSYVWPAASAAILLRPGTTVADSEIDFSTCQFRMYEESTTEQKEDPDNRRTLGRVVEDYSAILAAPETGFLITEID